MASMSTEYEQVLVLGEIKEQLERLNSSLQSIEFSIDHLGTSLRNQFAIAALALIKDAWSNDELAIKAFEIADAMMERIK